MNKHQSTQVFRYLSFGVAATALLGAGLVLTMPSNSPAQELDPDPTPKVEATSGPTTVYQATPGATVPDPIFDYVVTPKPKPGLLDVAGTKVLPLLDLGKGSVTFTLASQVDPKALTPTPKPGSSTGLDFKPYAVFKVDVGALDNLAFYSEDTGVGGIQTKYTFDKNSLSYQKTTDGGEAISGSFMIDKAEFTLSKVNSPQPSKSFFQAGLKINNTTVGYKQPEVGAKQFNIGFEKPGIIQFGLNYQPDGKTMVSFTKFFYTK